MNFCMKWTMYVHFYLLKLTLQSHDQNNLSSTLLGKRQEGIVVGMGK